MTRLLLTSFLVSIAAQGAETESQGPIHAALQAAIRSGQTPGAVLWMGHGKADLHWSQGDRARKPEREAMTEDTVFDAASLTKVVATLPSVLTLMDAGKIQLDAPVQSYIPEFLHRDITVKHLLTHSSGLPSGISNKEPWSGYDEGIRRACTLVPNPPPGMAFRYSDANFILLGEIVHRVSGQTLDVFAKEKVFKPLGMTSTGFHPGPELLPRVAPTERDEQGQMLRGVVHDPTSRRMGGVAGHAGLFTTAADLAKYARFWLEGGPLLKDETRRLATSVQSPGTMLELRGLGWDMDSRYSRPRGTLFPVGSFGHTGWTGTAMWMDPSSQSFFVLLTTRLHPDGKGNVRDLYEQIGTLVAQDIGIKQPANIVQPRRPDPEVQPVLNGIDVLERLDYAPLKGLRIGLITNHTGLDARKRSTIDLLHQAPGVTLVRLFSPEHGIRGQLDQEKIDDTRDERTGLPVVSLYGDNRSPKPEWLADVDALVFDIQDIGTRFYTYIGTMKNCMEAAAKAKKRFIVLDRINPIAGDRVEGCTKVDKATFTAIHPIPFRHGMTVGELARLFAAEGKLPPPTIIPLYGWERHLWQDKTKLPWENPSPNMRNLRAATLYPGIGLLEYAISVGRGTEQPFELIGAPWIKGEAFEQELTDLHLLGIRFEAARFTPTTSVFEKQACQGVRLIITDREKLKPVTVGLAIAHTLHRLYPKSLDMKKLNTLLNNQAAINAISADKPWKETAAEWDQRSEAFMTRRKPFLLY